MTQNLLRPVHRALISVSDKTGIVEFARKLLTAGVELISTGGTYRLLQEAGLEVTAVSEITQFPEIMDGRVKTLHPTIHGGLLGRRHIDSDVMHEHGIQGIDLLIVNLYPFRETIAREGCSYQDAIENIDIGGPAMLRASAKNHHDVTVAVDAADYEKILSEINNGGTTFETRQHLALKAFRHTAHYDAAIANYLDNQCGEKPAAGLEVTADLLSGLRYGENPHQAGAFYGTGENAAGTVAGARQVQGKELSYNNIADADAALECVKEFSDAPACVIVKHANPCGVAQSCNQLKAYKQAFATDPESAFGGIIAFNQTLEASTASAILEKQFVEVVIAPDMEEDVADIFSAKPNVRLLLCGQWPEQPAPRKDYKRVNAGILVQDADLARVSREELKVVSDRQPADDELEDMLFAWRVAKHVKSNAIVYVKSGRTIGVGAGQMSRVNSARIAGIKAAEAGLEVVGSVMASDAFFPFRDGIDTAAKNGIRAVIQPGGSIRDEEIIQAANEHGMAMVFTGIRHFRH